MRNAGNGCVQSWLPCASSEADSVTTATIVLSISRRSFPPCDANAVGPVAAARSCGRMCVSRPWRAANRWWSGTPLVRDLQQIVLLVLRLGRPTVDAVAGEPPRVNVDGDTPHERNERKGHPSQARRREEAKHARDQHHLEHALRFPLVLFEVTERDVADREDRRHDRHVEPRCLCAPHDLDGRAVDLRWSSAGVREAHHPTPAGARVCSGTARALRELFESKYSLSR